jgi:hypothetical protein
MRTTTPTTLAVILAALALTPGSIVARTRPMTYHGCGVLVDQAHPWHSHVPGDKVETGDHWITARAGRFSTCAFTKLAIHRLLALPARTYQPDVVAHLLGGVCGWFRGTGHETIRPFVGIQCFLPTPQRPHVTVTVRANVDPDPAFIH